MKQNSKKQIEQQKAEWDEQISRFLRGTMSQAEADAFHAELNNNKELRERAVLQARLIRQMRQVGEERTQRVADAMRSAAPEEIKMLAKGKGAKLLKPRKSLGRRLMPWISIAAVICCVAMVGSRWLGPHPVRTIERYAYSLVNQQHPHRIKSEPVQVNKLDSVSLRHQQLEELALLRGKIEMGLDVAESTRRLQAIFDQACNDKDTDYELFINDIAYMLMAGYDKLGNSENSKAVFERLNELDDDVLVSEK